MKTKTIGVLGAGAWGTALAMAARRAGCDVVIWARDPALAARLNDEHVNRDYLPGIALDPAIRATGDLAEAARCDAMLVVVPAQHLRWIGEKLAPLVAGGTDAPPLVICAKGIELGTGALMSEVLAEVLPGRVLAVLSGPTFAAEVARGQPSAFTLAAENADTGAALAAMLGSETFRPYRSRDVVGAQIGGAVKNVIAIACGVVSGRALGDNARAALITRGLAEVIRLGVALGGRPETLMGLSGLGDLTLTCTSQQSRNFSLGAALGAGESLDALLSPRRSVVEGVFSAAAVARLAAGHGIEMPITQAVDDILNRGADIEETIRGLLARPFTAETP